MGNSEKNEKKRTALQAVFDLLKRDDCDVFFGFAVNPRDGSLKFLPKSASAQKWFCDVYAEELVEEILKYHAPAHLTHRCSDFLNGVNVCYSNSDEANYFEPIRKKLESDLDRYLKQQTEHFKFLLRRGIAIRETTPVRDPAKIWSWEAVDRLMKEKGNDSYRIHSAQRKLMESFVKGDGPALFLEEYPEQAEFCSQDVCSEKPELLPELLSRILVLELLPRPERKVSKLPKGTAPGSLSFKFLMEKVKQVAAADSYDELWTLSRHIDYMLADNPDISESERKSLDRSVQEYSIMGTGQDRSMGRLKDNIFLRIRAGILETGDVDQCQKRVNDLLDQMLAQGKGGTSHG